MSVESSNYAEFCLAVFGGYERVFLRMTNLWPHLTAQQELVLRLRFGLVNDGRPRTRKEIAEFLGVSREMVRQAEGSALNKLRRVWMTPGRATRERQPDDRYELLLKQVEK